jgi:hypothetical protein
MQVTRPFVRIVPQMICLPSVAWGRTAPAELMQSLRIGVAIDCISYWGREQDYKVYWPCGLRFSDPTRNVPFALGE